MLHPITIVSFAYYIEKEIRIDVEIENSLLPDASASGAHLEPTQNKETLFKDEKKADFDVNEAIQVATIIDSSENPYYEGCTVDVQI